MADITVLPLADYQSGSHIFGPVSVPDGISALVLRVARCTSATPQIWPDASTTFAVSLDVFRDGEWRNWVGMTSEGGITLNRQGQEAAFSLIGGALPAGINRKLRGTVTIGGGPLRSTVSIEIL